MAIYTYEIDHGEEEPRIGANTKIKGDIIAVQFEPVFERLEKAEAELAALKANMSGPEKEQPKNVKEMVAAYLEQNGYDGLFCLSPTNGYCSCTVDYIRECVGGKCWPGVKTSLDGVPIGPREDKPE
jgi:hypothetical protein